MTSSTHAGGALSETAAIAVRSLHLMASGTREEFEEIVAPDAHNRESKDEPPETRGTGPAAFFATALWLRAAFTDLAWQVREAVQDGDVVVLHATMAGRQTGAFVAYRPDATVDMVFPPRSRPFSVTQTHWFRVEDGKVVEHWTNRDDLDMGKQLGWTPPTPPTWSGCCSPADVPAEPHPRSALTPPLGRRGRAGQPLAEP
jgi:predicted ester cyclase